MRGRSTLARGRVGPIGASTEHRWIRAEPRHGAGALIRRGLACEHDSCTMPPDTSSRHLASLADEELIQLMQRGDARAFELIYERHCGAAFSLAYRMVGTRNAAEDVVQEAFLAIWRSGSRYDRSRGSVRTWSLGIVHHRAIDALRRTIVHDRRRSSDEGVAEQLEARERTDVEAARREESRVIREALDGLPAEQSHVIELAYFGGFTHTEIADMLDTPVGTVKGRMRLGLHKMRDRLGAKEVAP